MKSVKKMLTLGLALSALSIPCLAQTVKIPLGQQGSAWSVKTPRTGQTMSRVEETFGSPLSKSGPVGQPPIYTWEYDSFNVYFEGNHVIHSVVRQMKK